MQATVPVRTLHATGRTVSALAGSPSCAVQGAASSEAQSSDELVKLRQELEASKPQADGHQHALQELSAQAQACLWFHYMAAACLKCLRLFVLVCSVPARGKVRFKEVGLSMAGESGATEKG